MLGNKQGDYVTVVVKITIKEDRLPEFHKWMEIDVKATREEEGCVRFDFLKVQGSNNKFVFYETYKNEDAFAFHNTTPKRDPQREAFGKFKESGVIEDFDVQLCDSINYTGFKKLALV